MLQCVFGTPAPGGTCSTLHSVDSLNVMRSGSSLFHC